MTAQQMKAARSKLDMTQEQFAQALGVDRTSVARWETGEAPIDQRTKMAVEHLGCNGRKSRNGKK